jgi:hypothetical protein
MQFHLLDMMKCPDDQEPEAAQSEYDQAPRNVFEQTNDTVALSLCLLFFCLLWHRSLLSIRRKNPYCQKKEQKITVSLLYRQRFLQFLHFSANIPVTMLSLYTSVVVVYLALMALP